MKEKPDCDYSRAKCSTTKNADGKESYACLCIAGYTGNSTNCIDFDECSTDSSNNCSKDAECINNPGSYECGCKDGFSGDGFTCKGDIDECAKKTICPANAICSNFKGSFGCRCKNGFDGKDPFKNCSDVDECLLGACGYTGQTCVNSVGSFECKCSPGFNQVGYGFGEDMCQDINECKTLEKPCGSYNYHKCVNKDGDYTCYCEYGFEFNKEKKTCEGNLTSSVIVRTIVAN
ncbi:fibulin-1-like [Montipora capricornis]|uniref:fibulin-1-like n=1 Tax=Montipora capricornis TaxID=246305 RepID=UPI0035F1AD6F